MYIGIWSICSLACCPFPAQINARHNYVVCIKCQRSKFAFASTVKCEQPRDTECDVCVYARATDSIVHTHIAISQLPSSRRLLARKCEARRRETTESVFIHSFWHYFHARPRVPSDLTTIHTIEFGSKSKCPPGDYYYYYYYVLHSSAVGMFDGRFSDDELISILDIE